MFKHLARLVICILFTAHASQAADKLNIVCTIGMIGNLVEEVGGDHVTVKTIMNSGVDPHLYKATRSDIVLLSQADIVFYNGLFLEGKMSDALIRVAASGKKVFAVTELLDDEYLLEPEEFQGHFDPHVWMDPQAWSKAVALIRDKLIDADPDNKEIYAKNARNYIDRLRKLDAYAIKTLSSIPKSSRVLVTAHDAFNYFGRRFEFEVIGIQGLSTDSEAGSKRCRKIVKLLVDRKISALLSYISG
ncbi:MAG: zinc ABC transporter substrate-binding protein [Bdellovibrionota bacterium]